MDDSKWFMQMNTTLQKQAVQKTNEYTQQFGLSLSEDDTQLLLSERKSTLTGQERVEFGEGVLPRLIYAFCDSAYIYQDNYVDAIGRLQQIFYFYKNETMDEVSDDELIAFMKEEFENGCQGSLDFLEETCLERMGRAVRYGKGLKAIEEEYE
ncbi:MAG: DUF6323 family protein [Lachnospiraceae bacterium]